MENELKWQGDLSKYPFTQSACFVTLIEKYLQHVSETVGHVFLDDSDLSATTVQFTEAELKLLRSFDYIN